MSRHNRQYLAALALILAVLSGAAGTVALYEVTSPDCPSDDACIADYRDGAWHISVVP